MKNEVKAHEVNPSNFKNRRDFLKISGLAVAGTGLLLMGCNDDDESTPDSERLPGLNGDTFDFGGGDLGILTYAYALEQLEADFYTKVVNATGFGSTFNATEQAVLTDLYNHEVIHREFFKAAISGVLNDNGLDPAKHLLPALSFNYGSLSFSSRDGVLATAKALEDTGVKAYNGAGASIANPAYLLLAGKIVSVEARHAAAIRSIINPNSKDFAGDDIVDAMGLDGAELPSAILPVARNFITNAFSANYLR